MSLLKSRFLHQAIGICVSLGAITWMVVSLEWSKVWASLADLHYWMVIPCILLIAVQMLMRGLRWKYLLPDEANLSTKQLTDIIFIGNLASNILPLRAGEVIRPILISMQSPSVFSTAFVSVVIERFFDLSTVLFFFALVVYFVPGVPAWVSNGAVGFSGLALAIFLFMVLGSYFPTRIMNLAGYVLSVMPRAAQKPLEKFLRDLLSGAAVLRTRSTLVWVSVLSALVWISTFALYWFFLLMFDLPPSISVSVATTVFVALAVAAPSAPGYVGVYQVACIAAFTVFRLPQETAAAFSIVTHVVQYLVITLYGAYALSRTNWSLGELVRSRPVPEGAS